MILQNRKKDDNDKEIKFFRSMTLFNNCSKIFIEQFTYCMQPVRYKRDEIIINQGEILDSIYFVRSGVFQVLYLKHNKLKTEIDLNYLTMITNKNERFTEDKQYELKGCINSKDIHKIFNLGEGEIIGDLEMLPPVKEYSYFTIKCIQDGSVLLQSKRQVSLF
jgi:CRP-like cAMP-binding protein